MSDLRVVPDPPSDLDILKIRTNKIKGMFCGIIKLELLGEKDWVLVPKPDLDLEK